MNKLMGIRFKRAFIIWLIVSVVVGAATAASLGLMYKDKISLANDYKTVSAEVRDAVSSLDIEDSLNTFAGSSSEVVDVYVLDADGKVLYSAKDSGLDTSGTLKLESKAGVSATTGATKNAVKDNTDEDSDSSESSDAAAKEDEDTASGTDNKSDYNGHERGEHGEQGDSIRGEDGERGERGHGSHEGRSGGSVYYDAANPDVTFKSIGGHGIMLKSAAAFEAEEEGEQASSATYSIGIFAGKDSGETTLFIFKLSPVSGAHVAMGIGIGLLCLSLLIYWLLVALYVYTSARKSKLSGALWGVVTLVTNLLGLCAYLIYKRIIMQTCPECKTPQSRKNIHCVYCGNELVSFCEACGAKLRRGDSYCRKCGSQSAAAEVQSVPASPEAPVAPTAPQE